MTEAASAAALLEEARRDWRAGWVAAAQRKLDRLLAAGNAPPGAQALMVEMLFSRQEIHRAGDFLGRARTESPDDLRLVVLAGEYAAAQGDAAGAVSLFREVLARDLQRPGAWSGLVALQARHKDKGLALATFRDGLATLTDPLPLWWAGLEALRRHGDRATLAEAARLLPAPASPERRVTWENALLAVGVLEPLLPFLEEGRSSDPALMDPAESWMLAELSLAAGDPGSARRLREKALAKAPATDTRLRTLWRECLWAGEIDAAEAVFARMAPAVRLRMGLEPLYEARVFKDVVSGMREAWALPAARRLGALARLVLDEPGAVNAAVALLHAFRGKPVSLREAAVGVTPRVWSRSPRSLETVAALSAGEARNLQERPVQRRAQAVWLARAPELAERTLSPQTRIDLARLSLLVREGGWWLDDAIGTVAPRFADVACGCVLLLVQQEEGLLHPGFIGAAAGHAALLQALDIAIDSCRGSAPRSYTRWETGAAALTLGVARHLAARILAGDACADVRVLRQPDVARELPGLPGWA